MVKKKVIRKAAKKTVAKKVRKTTKGTNRYGTDLRTKTLYLRVTPEVKEVWEKEATARGCSNSTLIEQLVSEGRIGKKKAKKKAA